MTTFHQVPLQVLPFNDSDKFSPSQAKNHGAHSPLGSSFTSSSTLSTTDISDLNGDLLPGLWQTSSNQSNNQLYQPPSFVQQSSMWNLTPQVSNSPSSIYNQQIQQQCTNDNLVRDPTADYSRLLLPNSLLFNTEINTLPALTEENLFFNSSTNGTANFSHRSSSFSDHSNDELFNFEQQQQFQQTNQTQAHPAQQNEPQVKNYSCSKPSNVNTQLYKTELCASFVKMGVCPYGNKCQFAHGENELKVIERSPKWRSKPCANWSKFGSCRYGNRCCFKHGN